MSILSLIINVLLFINPVLYAIYFPLVLSTNILDSESGDNNVLECPIERNKWGLPSIIQWYRSINNYSKLIASQFDDYPVHIDDLYQDRYRLFSNGSLKIENIQLNDNDTFECRLILIDRGLLDIKEKYFITLRVNEPPRFIKHSDPLQIATQHSTVDFICQIYAVPSPVITWYRILQHGKQITDQENLQLLSTNSQNLSLENVDDRLAGQYKCVGKNRLGSVQNEFKLFIRGSIYWRYSPENQTTKINESITLRCEGESSEPLQYQWFKDNVSLSDAISSQNRIRTFSDGILIINNIEPSDHGAYVCVIRGLNTTNVRSRPAIVSVKYPPTPSTSHRVDNLTFIRGSVGSCPCLLDAYPAIQSVSWYRNGKSIRIDSKGGAYSINSENGLIIKSAKIDDQGEYVCRAQNSEGFGRDSFPIFIEIKEPIVFVTKPNSIYRVYENIELTLPCIASGHPSPTIKWFKNSVELNNLTGNLTLDSVEKSDHGLYTCQATNKHTITNISTLIIVENTTPQAPLNIQHEQIGSNILLSWEPGYDGGHNQHFIIWYRMLQAKKQAWNQIRVLPENATEFLLFDLKLQQTYEIAIVAENSLGLGVFSPILSIYLNNNQDSSVGYYYYLNETNFLRPLSPTNIYLTHTGTNLHIKWNHPDINQSPVNIIYYVIQWRSTIYFNHQLSHQFVVVEYPVQSYILKDVRQSKYIVQIISYSEHGTYSIPVESEIDIQFNSILTYHGSSRLLILILCFLSLITVATLCVCLFCILKNYYHRRSYFTDYKADSKLLCCCFPSIQNRLDDCSARENDRYHATLLRTNDIRASPIYISRNRLTLRSNSSSFADSSISLAKVASIPRCRDSIISNKFVQSELPHDSLLNEKSYSIISPSANYSTIPITTEDSKVTSLFQPIIYNDMDGQRNSGRLPLEAVPELSELTVANSRYSFVQSLSSTIALPQNSHSVQANPMLITFDSSSMKRRN